MNNTTKTVAALRESFAAIEPTTANAGRIMKAARATLLDCGHSGPSSLGGVNASSKIAKGEKLNLHTFIMYLAPSDMAGAVNTCPQASEGCRAACLFNSGRAAFDDKINAARIARTLIYAASRPHFSAVLFSEIAKAQNKARSAGIFFSVRLNGTSDISPRAFKVNGVDVLAAFAEVPFYDYTKVWTRSRLTWPANYSLTYSWTDGRKWSDAVEVMNNGGALAVPFADLNAAGRIKVARSASLPTSYGEVDAAGRLLWSFPVFDGDTTDARYLDREQGAPAAGGYIVGLRAKRSTVEAERVALASGFFVPV
jgi:hypothetical protein